MSAQLGSVYQQPNVLKPLFITFNALAYLAYLITVMSYFLTNDDDSSTAGSGGEESTWVMTFQRVVAFVNGLSFFLLTVSLLNYGSRLEKIVHAVRVKGQH